MSSKTELLALQEGFKKLGYVTGDDKFPIGGYHMTLVGAQAGLDIDDVIDLFVDEYHIAAAPLGSDMVTDKYPNLYVLLTHRPDYKHDPDVSGVYWWGSDVTINELVNQSKATGFGMVFIAVDPTSVHPVDAGFGDIITELNDISKTLSADFGEALATSAVQIYPVKHILPSDQWVDMRVYVDDRVKLSASEIKTLLEGEGYKVVDPYAGLGAIYSDTDYLKQAKYTRVLFNPNGKVLSAASLQGSLFKEFGKTADDKWKVMGIFSTNQYLHDNQPLVDGLWQAQLVTGTAMDLSSSTVDTFTDLAKTLNSLLGVVPTLVKIAVGGAIAYGLWQVAKIVMAESKNFKKLKES